MSDNQKIGEDAQSFANFSESVVVQLDLDLKLDFSKKIFSGFVDVTAKIKQNNGEKIYLDTKFLEIKKYGFL
jgi:aminopeptidase N